MFFQSAVAVKVGTSASTTGPIHFSNALMVASSVSISSHGHWPVVKQRPTTPRDQRSTALVMAFACKKISGARA
eukprot:7837381-Lingulodinium_polyedra.AAC.1